MATRLVLGGSRTRLVLGGSSIVEGGFERSVSPATWEQRIRNVGGEMGFTSVGGGDLGLTIACGVELRLSLVGVWGGVMSSHRGWIGDAHWTVGGARTGVRERVELSHN